MYADTATALSVSAALVEKALGNKARVTAARATAAKSTRPRPPVLARHSCAPFITARAYLESRGFAERDVRRLAPVLGREVARRYTGDENRVVPEGTPGGRVYDVAAYPVSARSLFDGALDSIHR